MSFVIIVHITGSVFLSRGERQTNINPASVFLSRSRLTNEASSSPLMLKNKKKLYKLFDNN